MSSVHSMWIAGALVILARGQHTMMEALNRTREFTTKPGFCPTATEKPPDGCQTCVWDIDCPVWQKCCQTLNRFRCVNPATFSHYVANGGWNLNVTVTVKTDYHDVMALDKGLLNHTQLVHSMVSGALNSSDVSVQYLSSCPVAPYRTATSLIVGCNATLSLDDTTAIMQRLIRDIAAVSSVTVEDVDECAHTALRNCSPHAECNNTVASYHCTCRHGYTDVLPQNAGASCEAPPQLTQLSSFHITGTSFCLSWSGPTPSNQTSYLVDLRKGSEIISHQKTNETTLNVTGLAPGVLYSITVTPYACDSQGESRQLNVKTAAQTFTATARVTNMNFTEAFLNSSSQAYLNFSMSFKKEIYKSLSPELSKLVDSGKVRIEITSLSPGSVVVNVTIVYDVSYTMLNMSSAVLSSLLNSTKYIVDENSTSVSDFNECALGLNDWPQNALCNNTWGAYTCVCNGGFEDMDSDWPGRVCGRVYTTTTSLTTTTTVDNATPSLSPPTTVPTATTSLALPPTVPIVYPHKDMPTINKVLPPISVECSLKAIIVTLAQEFLQTRQISELSLHLGQASNRPLKLNNTHVRLTVALNNTTLLSVSNDSYLTARVTLFNSPEPLTNGTKGIAHKLQVPISCTYRKSVFISANEHDYPGYNMNMDPISASGSFEVVVQLLKAKSPLPHNYTLSPDEDVVVKVSINTSAEETKLVISQCWTTPTINREDSPSYIFRNSGCPLPNSYTAIISNGKSSSSSLSVRIFSIVELDVVYLHCQVQICVEMGLATCVPACSERKARLAKTVGTAVGSSGALLRQNEESLENELDMLHLVGFSVLGIGMTLAFLAGLICLFFYQRNRIGHYNFNIKPKQDNFTFHVFNA
ncbi:unnamed protein product [Lota lota]